MSNILAGFKKVNVFAGTMASKTLGVKTDVNNSISRPPTELLFEAVSLGKRTHIALQIVLRMYTMDILQVLLQIMYNMRMRCIVVCVSNYHCRKRF